MLAHNCVTLGAYPIKYYCPLKECPEEIGKMLTNADHL